MLKTNQNINFGSITPSEYNPTYAQYKNYNGEKPDKKILTTIKKYIPKGGLVADIGAGDGRNTIPLARKGYRVDAFELSSVGRGIISEKIKAEKLSKVNLSADNIHSKPFGEIYDAIFMSHVTQHFESKELPEVFQNIKESLKQGGVFIFDAFIAKNERVKKSTQYDSWSGNYHFNQYFIENLVKSLGMNVTEVSDFKEKDASKGKYPNPKWGFQNKNSGIKEVNLKWFICENPILSETQVPKKISKILQACNIFHFKRS